MRTRSREFDWMMNEDLKELLFALNAYEVKYLVVGDYAVGVHTEPRATKYLDIFICADEQNSQAVYRALAAYGASLQGFSPADFNDEQGSAFQIGQPPARIDILQRIDGINFDEVWEDRVEGFSRRRNSGACHLAGTLDSEQTQSWTCTGHCGR